MPSHKIAKISSDMMRVISSILFEDARDEILKTITITGCKVSSDLVNEAAPFIRGLVAEKLDLRHTPEITFIYDDSVEYANRIEKIIKEIHEEK